MFLGFLFLAIELELLVLFTKLMVLPITPFLVTQIHLLLIDD
jgi:hypothetical protein